MAESIVRLRVESSEYDAKLRRAADGLRTYVDNAKKAGESVSQAGKDTLEFVKALGNMDTVSRNAKGKLSEMTKAFTELSVQYKNLTQEEKNSPFGQALANSLDNLKTRINESKNQLAEVNRELGNTKGESQNTEGVLDKLAGKFGLTGGEAMKMGAILGVATTACKVAKDAFFSNEEQLDEWGRVVASSESLYRGFLHSLNNGDISGFLNNMSNLVAAARAAYDAMDELYTFSAFNQVQFGLKRQNFMDAQNDFREGVGSKESVQAAANALKGDLNQQRDLQKKAYATQIVKYATERNVDVKSLAQVMLGQYGDYRALKALPLTGTKSYTMTDVKSGQTWTQTTKVAANEAERMGDMLRKFNDEELKNLQGLGAQVFQTGFEMAQIDRQTNRILNGRNRGGGGGGGGVIRSRGGGGGGVNTPPPPPEGSIAAQEALVQSLTKKWREASDQAGRDGYLKQLEEAKKLLDEMQGKTEAPAGSMKALSNELSDLQQKQQLVTSAEEWQAYEERIKGVKQQMSDLKGVVEEMAVGFSGLTGDSLSAWMGAQRTSLGGMEIGSGAYMQTQGNIIDTQTLQNVLNATLSKGIVIDPATREALFEQILSGEDIPDSVWTELQDSINKNISKGIEPLKIDVDTGNVTGLGKQVGESWKDAARAVNSVGSALQQLENPSAKIAGIVGQAIAQIALGFAQATAADSKLGVFGWIAAIAGGLGTMISTISAIHSATGYAEGGIVKGDSYSGDNLFGPSFGINAGELVLNRAQQGALASQLEGGANNLNLSAVVTAEDLVFVLNNRGKRTGRGEFVTSH